MYDTKVWPGTETYIREAAKLLQRGEVVGMPTETVYGLAGDATNPEAVARIFAAKSRPSDNPLIVHIAAREQLEGLVRRVPEAARKAMEAFWPGPLTLIMPKGEKVGQAVTAGLDTVAVRWPAHPVAQRLILASGLPIAAPSANTSGRPSTTEARHVLEDLGGKIPAILDGGPSKVGLESTVLDTTGEVPVVLRPGGVTAEELRGLLGEVRVHESALMPLEKDAAAPSPGMKHKHYAPKAPAILFEGEVGHVAKALGSWYDEHLEENPYILALADVAKNLGGRRVRVMGGSTGEAAHSVFAELRALDEAGAGLILIQGVDKAGIGLAVMNRLLRASGFHVVEV
ncbi:L-threonylcarbamoyladenylate synthase [Gehongia tenuis]|uniref:L-threonylcarbamoyladenylate synthase n=1 Tax=Gehongia tenuis TaxID=2763655 RepID=UPI002016A118